MVWRPLGLAIAVLLGLALTAAAEAPGDYSYESWVQAYARFYQKAAEAEAAERGKTVEEVLARERGGWPFGYWYLVSPPPTPEEQKQAELEQYAADKAEAASRHVSFYDLLGARAREREIARREAEAKARRQHAIETVMQGVVATIALGALATLFVVRRRIAAGSSRRWRSKSWDFRAWAFAGIFWAIGTLLYVWLADPYDAGSWVYMSGDEILHMLSVMIVPPLFFGALWFGYKRFVR